MSFEKYVKYLDLKCKRPNCEGDLIVVEGGNDYTLLKCLKCLRTYNLRIALLAFSHLFKRYKEKNR